MNFSYLCNVKEKDEICGLPTQQKMLSAQARVSRAKSKTESIRRQEKVIYNFTIYNLFIYLQFIYLITIYQFINQLFINLLTI